MQRQELWIFLLDCSPMMSYVYESTTERIIMKTHLIKDTGEVIIVRKPEHLDEMQGLVKGPIEVVNAAMPKASSLLKDSEDLKEMICNEEGLFNSNFKTNEKARQLIAEGLGVSLAEITDIRGDVFVTDGWRLQ